MGKKNRKGAAGKASKGSKHGVKIANKHMTKLARRGKLTPAMRARLKDRIVRRETGAPMRFKNDGLEGYEELYAGGSETEEEALPLDMVDLDEVNPADDHHVSRRLLQGLEGLDSEPTTKRRKTKGSATLLADWDQEKRSFGTADEGRTGRLLLPIKDPATGRVVMQYAGRHEALASCQIERDSPDEGYDSGAPGADAPAPSSVWSINQPGSGPHHERHLTGVELLQRRQALLGDYRNRIAQHCTKIISDPQEHIAKTKELLAWASGVDVESLVVTSVAKLCFASLLEIFLDIIPGYPIRPLTEKEDATQVKKDTKKLREFEQGLLKYHKQYLQLLEERSKGTNWAFSGSMLRGCSGEATS